MQSIVELQVDDSFQHQVAPFVSRLGMLMQDALCRVNSTVMAHIELLRAPFALISLVQDHDVANVTGVSFRPHLSRCFADLEQRLDSRSLCSLFSPAKVPLLSGSGRCKLSVASEASKVFRDVIMGYVSNASISSTLVAVRGQVL
jgi:hypothetical protein